MTTDGHTFLFCDLVGFTALTDSEGDERAAAVAAALHNHACRLAAQHRAEVVKAMGDAAMIRCEDPAAAVLLALRLVDRVEADPALPPIRVGVHSGPAVALDGDWYGRTVNVAARLCTVAAGGEVLVSESTLSAARELPRVSVGERRLHWLKNVTEPVAARAAELEPRPSLAARLRLTSCPLWVGRRSQATVGGAGL
ncbi:MAG TPA: adenylate/guanylate cyclase domain-containing protein [Solirubrobacterales bacterium]|nr:adenylate/guanylate cyclase domain-containing protein [Solirubrobacterales bacterium]